MSNIVKEIHDRTVRDLSSFVPLDNAFEVVAVHEGSIAHAAGISEGMIYFAEQSDQDAGGYTALEAFFKNEPVVSRFANLRDREEIRLHTARFPFGVELLPTSERLCRLVLGGAFVTSDAAARFHRGDHLEIQEIAAAFAERHGRKSLGSKLLQTALSFGAIEEEDTDRRADEILIAVWAAENRDFERALSLLPDSDDSAVYHHGGVLTSLYYYAVALCIENAGASVVEVTSLLEVALDYRDDSRLIRRKLAAVSGQATMSNTPKQMPFPYLYSLPANDPLHGHAGDKGDVISLRETLQSLKENEFLIVILLSGYRCNGYYSLDMELLAAIWPVLGQYFPYVHVVTSAPPGCEFNDWWMDGEVAARNADVPVMILHDANDIVPEEVGAESSPHVVILDRSGMVVNNPANGIEQGIWNAVRLASNNAPEVKATTATAKCKSENQVNDVSAIVADPVSQSPKKPRFGRPPLGFTLRD